MSREQGEYERGLGALPGEKREGMASASVARASDVRRGREVGAARRAELRGLDRLELSSAPGRLRFSFRIAGGTEPGEDLLERVHHSIVASRGYRRAGGIRLPGCV